MSHSADPSKVSPLARFYDKTVLAVPALVLLVVAGVTAFFGYYIKDFKMDASSDSIVLENDVDLRYYDETRELFGSDDYVVITVTPDDDLFATDTLALLSSMIDELHEIESVESITSILNVPLFHSPDISLFKLATDYRTLEKEGTDPELARAELIASPLFNDYLISKDGKTTAVQVNFEMDAALTELEGRRYELRDLEAAGTLGAEDALELEDVEVRYAARHGELNDIRGKEIETIRGIISDYESNHGIGELHLGGVPMIVADIISYVERDIVRFLYGVLAFILVMLLILFTKPKWVILPTATCAIAVIIMMGFLGFRDWRTTIVTSNFSSLLLIVTLAMTIHIVVHYQELYARFPDLSNRELILRTVRFVALPCFFTALTTAVGFGSLIVSGIRPVMDFGLMMTAGLGVAYVLCFVFFPAALRFFPKGKVPPKKIAELTGSPLSVLAHVTDRFRWPVAIGAVGIFIFCLVGISRLRVENSFIDYFKKDSPIATGMTVIDNRLGGTTPLEIILDGEGENYWLQKENLAKLGEIHDWIDAQPETGKVISIHTMNQILTRINKGKPLSTGMLTLMKSRIPPEIADAVLTPYSTPDLDKVRIAMRVRETDKTLNRKELMQRMHNYLENESGMPPGTTHITGVFVLYNNMLQSLFQSQIKTIVAVIAAIWIMFLLLFRSAKWATIGIIPNILPVVLVLGTLGWVGIPLDMMTIMIAAVTFGIAVDDTIHYIHRFQVEFPEDRNYVAAMYRCHNSIGRAILYTSVTIVAGFSILMSSEFVPTVYFGLFTGLAMIVALLAAMTLLPLLIITWKPLGPETKPE